MGKFQFPRGAQAVYDALKPDETRLVGGAVRSYLEGKEWPEDLDMATTASAEEIAKKLERAGIHAVRTGGSHGTVTAVVPSKNGKEQSVVEVTPLREDVVTDGRHAEVQFTQDWQKDAQRRDFTMNSIYIDVQGQVVDFVQGVEDLKKGLVRFVGNAEQRIREDYLRILRYFRFVAAYGEECVDAVSWKASIDLMPLLNQLSAERVTKEFLSFLINPFAGEVLGKLLDDVELPFLPFIQKKDALRLLWIKQNMSESFSVMQFLYFLGGDEIAAHYTKYPLLTFSKSQLTFLKLCLKARALSEQGEYSLTQMAYLTSVEAVQTVFVYNASQNKSIAKDVWLTYTELLKWERPDFTVTSEDVWSRKNIQGKALGDVLRLVETWWLQEDFPDRTACLAHLDKILCEKG